MKRISSIVLAFLIATSSALAMAPASSADAVPPAAMYLQRPAPGGQMDTQGFSSELKAWMCRTFGSMCG